MVIGRMRELALGRPVYSGDGAKLGTVKELQLDAFQVAACAQQPDYWLPMRCVVATGADGLWLDFQKKHLDDFKLGSPPERYG